MRRNGSATTESERELHMRMIRTLITCAKEIFESDQTEKYANPQLHIGYLDA